MITKKTIIDINYDNLKTDILNSSFNTKYVSFSDYDNDTNEISIELTESLTTQEDQELDLIISNHDSTPSESIEAEYQKHESSGNKYYRQIQSLLAKEMRDGVRDFPTTRTIEMKLQSTLLLLIKGNWMSAKDEIENNVVSNESDLTASLKASIIADMTTYINENY